MLSLLWRQNTGANIPSIGLASSSPRGLVFAERSLAGRWLAHQVLLAIHCRVLGMVFGLCLDSAFGARKHLATVCDHQKHLLVTVICLTDIQDEPSALSATDPVGKMMSNASAMPYPRDLIPQGTLVLSLMSAEHYLQIHGSEQSSGAAQYLSFQPSSWVALPHQ